jgi:biopolymer transport protein ExbD
MVGTKFTESESNIQINLPKVAPNGAMLPSPSSKTVYLTTDGAIRIDGQQVNQEQLTNLLAQAVRNFPDTTVQIKLDGSIPFQQAADIASAIYKSGAKLNGVALATYQMPGPRR